MSHNEYGPLASYTSLADPNLSEYFQKKPIRRHLIRNGLITRKGEIVPEPVIKMKSSQRQKHRSLEARFIESVLHKSLDTERIRQVKIRQKLEEISRIEMVARIRAQEKNTVDESSHKLAPLFTHSPYARNSTYSARKEQERDDAEDLELIDIDQSRRRLRKKFPKQEIDTKHLGQLDTLGLREYASVLERMQKQQKNPADLWPPQQNQAQHKPPRPPSPRQRRRPKSSGERPKKAWANIHHTEPTLHGQAHLQSLCDVKMTYHGQRSDILLGRDHEVIILQQHCGGNTYPVFKSLLKPGSEFTFVSRRHRTYPFGISIYVNGVIDCRVSTCCEYKHRPGTRLGGPSGKFSIKEITGAAPCYQCQAAKSLKAEREREERRKRKEKENEYEDSFNDDSTKDDHEESENEEEDEEEEEEDEEEEGEDEKVEKVEQDDEDDRFSEVQWSEDEKEESKTPVPVVAVHVDTDNDLENEKAEEHEPSPRPESSVLSESDNEQANEPKEDETDHQKSPSISSSEDEESEKDNPSLNSVAIDADDDEPRSFIDGNYLRIHRESLNSNDIDKICKDLKNNKNIRHISLIEVPLNEESLKQILNSISDPENLRTLRLESVGMTSQMMQLLTEKLIELKSIEDLSLQNNPLDNESVRLLVKGLKKHFKESDKENHYLSSLSLSCTHLTTDSCTELERLLAKNVPIRRLELTGNDKISLHAWQYIGRGLGKNVHLEELLLDHCALQNDQLEAIVNNLNHENQLKSIDLEGNDLDDDCLPILLPLINRCDSLTKITFNSGNVRLSHASEDEITQALIRKVKNYFIDGRVKICNPPLDKKAINSMLEQVKKADRVLKVRIQDVTISSQIFEDIFYNIKQPRIIKSLSFVNTSLSEDNARVLEDFIPHCQQLNVFNLTQVSLSLNSLKMLLNAIKIRGNSSASGLEALKRLRLRECRFDDSHPHEMIGAVCEMLKSKIVLNELDLSNNEGIASQQWAELISTIENEDCTIERVTLCHCELDSDCLNEIVNNVGGNDRLKFLDISNNPLGNKVGEEIMRAKSKSDVLEVKFH